MLPQIGKVDQKTFEKVIFPRLGKPDNRVLRLMTGFIVL